MALNISVFKTRALTALIFVIIMLAGLLINTYSFIVLFTIIFFGCCFEYVKLANLINNNEIDANFAWIKYMPTLSAIGIYSSITLSYWFEKVNIYKLLPFCIVAALISYFLVVLVSKHKKLTTKNMVYAYPLLAAISFGFLHFLRLNYINNPIQNLQNNGGLIIVLCLISSIWINDTMAYIVGSFIGKTPLSKISPKKTWEGTIGGIVLAIITVVGICVYWLQVLPLNIAIAISATCAIVGTIGDLFESKIKRLAGVKDSGNFMPGHGGFLDRFDSLLLAAPAVYIVLQFV